MQSRLRSNEQLATPAIQHERTKNRIGNTPEKYSTTPKTVAKTTLEIRPEFRML
jgi:hypothetical protein